MPGLQAKLLADIEEITVAEVIAGPRQPTRTPQRHSHARALCVLEGELTLRTPGGDLLAQTGSWVQLPAGACRAIAVPGRPVRFLDIHSPGFRQAIGGSDPLCNATYGETLVATLSTATP